MAGAELLYGHELVLKVSPDQTLTSVSPKCKEASPYVKNFKCMSEQKVVQVHKMKREARNALPPLQSPLLKRITTTQLQPSASPSSKHEPSNDDGQSKSAQVRTPDSTSSAHSQILVDEIWDSIPTLAETMHGRAVDPHTVYTPYPTLIDLHKEQSVDLSIWQKRQQIVARNVLRRSLDEHVDVLIKEHNLLTSRNGGKGHRNKLGHPLTSAEINDMVRKSDLLQRAPPNTFKRFWNLYASNNERVSPFKD